MSREYWALRAAHQSDADLAQFLFQKCEQQRAEIQALENLVELEQALRRGTVAKPERGLRGRS